MMRPFIAGTLYIIVSFVSLALGTIYIFRHSFLPYHADALQSSWADVDPATQTLILALMDVAGAGWVTLGLIILVLVAIPFRARQRWARLLIPVAILTFYVPTLMATLAVTVQTPATAPWYGNAAAIISALIGLILDAPWKADQSQPTGK